MVRLEALFEYLPSPPVFDSLQYATVEGSVLQVIKTGGREGLQGRLAREHVRRLVIMDDS